MPKNSPVIYLLIFCKIKWFKCSFCFVITFQNICKSVKITFQGLDMTAMGRLINHSLQTFECILISSGALDLTQDNYNTIRVICIEKRIRSISKYFKTLKLI